MALLAVGTGWLRLNRYADRSTPVSAPSLVNNKYAAVIHRLAAIELPAREEDREP
jgi:hypothetical protein